MLLGLALLAAADRSPSLVGTWAFATPHRDASLPVEPCETDHGVRYAADGTWTDLTGEETGTWRQRGVTLREKVTARRNDVTGVHARVREPATTTRLRWFGRDHLNTVIAGEERGLVRCPPTR